MSVMSTQRKISSRSVPDVVRQSRESPDLQGRRGRQNFYVGSVGGGRTSIASKGGGKGHSSRSRDLSKAYSEMLTHRKERSLGLFYIEMRAELRIESQRGERLPLGVILLPLLDDRIHTTLPQQKLNHLHLPLLAL